MTERQDGKQQRIFPPNIWIPVQPRTGFKAETIIQWLSRVRRNSSRPVNVKRVTRTQTRSISDELLRTPSEYRHLRCQLYQPNLSVRNLTWVLDSKQAKNGARWSSMFLDYPQPLLALQIYFRGWWFCHFPHVESLHLIKAFVSLFRR